jgi:hypothetical protein
MLSGNIAYGGRMPSARMSVSEVACTFVRSPLPAPGIADLVTCSAYRRPWAVLRVSISWPQ